MTEDRVFSFYDKQFEIYRTNVLLKAISCINAGYCTFCSYWEDNEPNIPKAISSNIETIKRIPVDQTGLLEIAPSASIFELPYTSISQLCHRVFVSKFDWLQTETRWEYRNLITNLKYYFSNSIPKITVKIGIETFNNELRDVLGKRFTCDYKEVLKYTDCVNMLIGIPGQTIEDVKNDIKICGENFQYTDYNILDPDYLPSTWHEQIDMRLIDWFLSEGKYIAESHGNIKVWENAQLYVTSK